MEHSYHGSCLCGTVSFKSTGEAAMTAHCHCTDCRKSSGTGHASHIAIPKEQISIKGNVKGYSKPADSGNIVTRYFCPECVSPIYSTNSGLEALIFPRASILDNPDSFEAKVVVYRDSAVSWDKIDNNLPSFPGMPE